MRLQHCPFHPAGAVSRDQNGVQAEIISCQHEHPNPPARSVRFDVRWRDARCITRAHVSRACLRLRWGVWQQFHIVEPVQDPISLIEPTRHLEPRQSVGKTLLVGLDHNVGSGDEAVEVLRARGEK